MPKLSSDEIKNRISSDSFYGITLDTCIISKLDYNFHHPLLNALDQFQHSQIKVIISEIIEREVKSHIVEKAEKEQRTLNAAIEKQVKRWMLTIDTNDLTDKLALSGDPKALANDQFSHFVNTAKASIVPAVTSTKSTNELLNRYFNFQHPFGDNKSRKNEFPDAFALLSLELVAEDQRKLILCVSGDNAWKQFCDESDHLVCVEELSHALSYFNESGLVAANHAIATLKRGGIKTRQFVQLIDEELEVEIDTLDFEAHAKSEFIHDVSSQYVELQDVDFSSASNPRIVKATETQVTFSFFIDVHVKFFASFYMYVVDGIDKDTVSLDNQSKSQEDTIRARLVVTTMIGKDTELTLNIVEISKETIIVHFDEIQPFAEEYHTHGVY